jgi:hypothetical protein
VKRLGDQDHPVTGHQRIRHGFTIDLAKRKPCLFNNVENLRLFEKFQDELERVEMEAYPVRLGYLSKLRLAYVRRRPELLV